MYWGAPDFNYVVQLRRKTLDESEDRWASAHQVIIEDGNNNSLPVSNPGYYVEWEFRIRSRNRNGTSKWTQGSGYSGQDSKYFNFCLHHRRCNKVVRFPLLK